MKNSPNLQYFLLSIDWSGGWGGAVTRIDGVVCWFGWFGCKNDTFSLSHYFPEDRFSLSLMQREKDKWKQKKETPCHKGMGPQLVLKNENNHWWYLKGKDDWMKIWYMQVEEKTQTHSKMCKHLLMMIFANLLENSAKHEANNANLLKDCANLNRNFCKLE